MSKRKESKQTKQNHIRFQEHPGAHVHLHFSAHATRKCGLRTPLNPKPTQGHSCRSKTRPAVHATNPTTVHFPSRQKSKNRHTTIALQNSCKSCKNLGPCPSEYESYKPISSASLQSLAAEASVWGVSVSMDRASHDPKGFKGFGFTLPSKTYIGFGKNKLRTMVEGRRSDEALVRSYIS